MIGELGPGVVVRGVDAALVERSPKLVRIPEPEPVLGERVLEPEPAPRRLHVDLVPSEREPRGPERDRRDPLDERLHPHHRVLCSRRRPRTTRAS